MRSPILVVAFAMAVAMPLSDRRGLHGGKLAGTLALGADQAVSGARERSDRRALHCCTGSLGIQR